MSSHSGIRPVTQIDISSAVGSYGEQHERSIPPGSSKPHESATNKLNQRYGPPKPSGLPRSYEPEPSTLRDFRARKGSPWEIYEQVFNLDLNGTVVVALRKAPLAGLVAVRALPIAAADKALSMHKRTRHQNIVEVLDAFITETSLFVITEHMPISLQQIVDSAKYPTERQLAAILQQIINGLAYLEEEGLEHGSINCANVVLSTVGDVKIANQQLCDVRRAAPDPRDVRALGIVMMELMQKYTQENGAVGVENLDRWPSDSDAVVFLSETTSAVSARELKKAHRPTFSVDYYKLTLLACIPKTFMSKRRSDRVDISS